MSDAGDAHLPLNLHTFALERYFARFEHNPIIKHHACSSDSEPLSMSELLHQYFDDDSRHRWDTLDLSYTEAPGLHSLRQEVVKKFYTTINADQHILIAAPQEVIFLAMRSLVQPGDTIVCMHPAYQSLYEVAASAGATVQLWHCKTDHDDASNVYFDVDDLRSLVSQKPVKVVVVNVPGHNPTGWLPTRQEWTEIRDICASSSYPSGGAYLFSDEMYRGLELHPEEDSLVPGVDLMAPGRGISLGGMSKAVGLPGLRIGWLATSDATLLKTASSLKDYTTICNSAPSEILALGGVRQWDQIVAERQMTIIRHNLQVLDEYVNGKWKGIVQWKGPKAGSVGWAVIPLVNGWNIEKMTEVIAEQVGVMLLPETVYYTSTGNGSDSDSDMAVLEKQSKGRVRIGYARKGLPAALEALHLAFTKLGIITTGST